MVWNRNFNNPAHVALDKLFQENQIKADTKPSLIYQKKGNDVFKNFPLSTFRNVFLELKSKYGLSLKGSQDADADDSANNNTGEPSSKRVKLDKRADEEQPRDDDALSVVHYNQPVQTSLFRDPTTQQVKVIIVAALIGGVSDVEFSLVGDGPGTRLARIDYRWPQICVNIEAIFSKEIASGLPSCHPKIVELKKDLESTRESIEEIPRGSIEITLPISVQTVSSSISITGRRTLEGVKLMIVELMSFESRYAVKKEDKKVVFDDMEDSMLIQKLKND